MAGNNVLQYVGARYVPVFYNNPNGTWDWLSGVQYEPLTIVKYGTSTYTSKKLVPSTVSAPNTAPDYWALTGDYNGAIVDLQQSIQKLESDSQYGDSLQALNVLFIADSYGIAEYTNWAQEMVNWVESVGGTAQNGAISGSNWNGTHAPAYISALQNASNKQDLRQIIIGGGVNDIYDYNVAGNAIKNFMSYVKSNCPKARVYFVFMGKINGKYVNDSKTYTQEDVIKAYNTIKILCQDSGIIWGENAQEILHNTTFFLADGVHPSNAALPNILYYMKNAVMGNFPHTSTTELNSDLSVTTIVSNGMTKLFFLPSINIIPGNATWNTWYTIPGIGFPVGYDNTHVFANLAKDDTSIKILVYFREYNNAIQVLFSYLETPSFTLNEATSIFWAGFAILSNSSLVL